MDRIHRLGQYRPVHAIKLVVEDSIESRIVQLQEKKSAMVDATLSSDESAMGRLTPEDLGAFSNITRTRSALILYRCCISRSTGFLFRL
jgi:DNA repair protein RAD16